jgi:hypothetical protein
LLFQTKYLKGKVSVTLDHNPSPSTMIEK